MGISRRIEQVTRGAFLVKPGSLFPALHRMEEAGWLVSLAAAVLLQACAGDVPRDRSAASAPPSTAASPLSSPAAKPDDQLRHLLVCALQVDAQRWSTGGKASCSVTIRNLSAQAIALQVVAYFALSSQSGSDRVSEPYKCYVDPNSGGAVTPYITALMGGPDGGGPSVPFLAYVPKTPLQLQVGESRLLTVDTARLPWCLDAAEVPFARLPSGDRDLVFTLEADAGSGAVVSNSTPIGIQ